MKLVSFLSISALVFFILFPTQASAQDNCTWVKDYNSSHRVHICIEPSPENIGNLEVKPVLPAQQFQPVYAQVGDMVELKYIMGANVKKDLFVGFLNRTRRAPIAQSHDPSEIGDFLLGPGTKHTEAGAAWDSPVYWPEDEEGIRMSQLGQKGLTLPSGDWLISIKYELSGSFCAWQGDAWDFDANPLLWGVLCDYDKAYPFYYLIDASGTATSAKEDITAPPQSRMAAIFQNGNNLSINLKQDVNSTISLNSLNGRTVIKQQGRGGNVTLSLSSLPMGVYSLHIAAAGNRIVQNVLVR
ncbi:MAG: T9SS type A sorting domain-containing protein [Chitinivibrionales bacterium]|nr:T9SS type A sorting domain-containing protein [Chitinivibrionales bacterium]